MAREIPKPNLKEWFKTKLSSDGWLMPFKDRGFVGDQHTLFDLDDHVFPHCEQKRVAVQAGSGIGMWPARLAENFDYVYTFEPNPELYYVATRNSPQGNIFRYQAALGNERGMVDMSWGFSRDNYGGFYVTGKGPIPTLRIDDLALENVDLIMIDIEGAELEAFKGAEQTIKRCKPVLVWESKDACLRRWGIQKIDVYRYLKSLGYKQATTFHQGKDELWIPKF